MTRKSFLNLPYSCIQPFLQRGICLSERSGSLSHDVAGKQTIEEVPFAWNKCASYIFKVDGKSIVKKLDIEKSIFENISSKEQQPFLYDSVLNHHAFIEKSVQKSCDCHKEIWRSRNNSVFSNGPPNHCLQLKTRPHKDLQKNYDKQLPTHDQLDDMMKYFIEQAPYLFKSCGWSYQKCSYKILFENNILGSRTESLNAYIFQINVMKNITRFFLFQPELNILQMTKDIGDGSIHVRWQVDGIPRYLIPFMWLGLSDGKKFARYINGFSIFYVESDGLYHRHILTNMTPIRNDNRKTLSQFLVAFGLYRTGLEGNYPEETAIPSFQNQRTNKY